LAEVVVGNERRRAERELAAALPVFERLGSVREAERARACAREGRGRGVSLTQTKRRRTLDGFIADPHNSLYWLFTRRREAAVVTLVAGGSRTARSPPALGISIKTASVPVSHILRKLDAPNRLEAASAARRRRDTSGSAPGAVGAPDSNAGSRWGSTL